MADEGEINSDGEMLDSVHTADSIVQTLIADQILEARDIDIREQDAINPARGLVDYGSSSDAD
jgi:uncharacterized protein YabE (DUF348 family)